MQIRAYLLSMGFSLAFGSMFAKTYRVHRIFTRSCIGVVKNKVSHRTRGRIYVCACLMSIVLQDSTVSPRMKNEGTYQTR